MRICIDVREALAPQKTGKGQWTAGLINELRTRDLELTLLADQTCEKSGVVRLPSGIRWHVAVTEYLRSSPDVGCYLSTTSFIVPALLPPSFPVIQIIHDLIAFQSGYHAMKATLIERFLLPRVVRKHRNFCAISASTKHDLCVMFPLLDVAHIAVVHAGPMEESPAANIPDAETILCVGTLCPRKNQLRLIRVYAALPSPLREKYRLVLAGSRGWHDAEVVRMAKNTKGVEWIGYVSDRRYKELLHTCSVFALPSLYEGFGMQILDALQRGIPVLTSDRGSLKELAGTAAVLVDPESDRSILSGLMGILENSDLRAMLRERGPVQAKRYSWKTTADLVLSAIESAVY